MNLHKSELAKCCCMNVRLCQVNRQNNTGTQSTGTVTENGVNDTRTEQIF